MAKKTNKTSKPKVKSVGRKRKKSSNSKKRGTGPRTKE